MAAYFLQQRLYPTLQMGLIPQVAHGRRKAPFHCRQGDWDSACGFHCAAMVLALLGSIGNVKALSRQRSGVAARLWRMSQDGYFAGIDGPKLTTAIESLGTRLESEFFSGKHTETLAFTQQQLAAGDLVILGWRTPDRAIDHWVVALGMEGMQTECEFTPHTLLVMDPSFEEPWMCGYNGRLECTVHPLPGKPSYIRYTTNDGSHLPVTLSEAVAIRKRSTKEGDNSGKGGGF